MQVNRIWSTLLKLRTNFQTNFAVKPQNHKTLLNALRYQQESWVVSTDPSYRRNLKSCGCYNSRHENDRNEHRARQGGPYFQVKHDWLDAVGWSGVLLLSWYLCQPYCCRRAPSKTRDQYRGYINGTHKKYSSIGKCLSGLIIDSPAKFVVPSVQAVKPSATPAKRAEALRVGCENLAAAHDKVTSALKNFLGTECMQKGLHEEAFSHFTEAAKTNNSSAIFNLGICYEMGLGTKQCFSKAAKLYEQASDLGHATAMYNLGVFYVHGWGGVTADDKKARQLFAAAARLGQLDAQRALHLDSQKTMFQDVASGPCVPPGIEPKSNDVTELWFKVLNIQLYKSAEGSPKGSVDSGINELSPSDQMDFFDIPKLK